MFAHDLGLNVGVNVHSMNDVANCFLQGEAVHIIAGAALGGGAPVVAVLADVRDVAHDAEGKRERMRINLNSVTNWYGV